MYKLQKVRGPWETEGEWQERSQQRAVVIEMEPRCLVLRLKGCRARFRLPYSKLYQLAVMAEASANRRPHRSVKRGVIGGAR